MVEDHPQFMTSIEGEWVEQPGSAMHVTHSGCVVYSAHEHNFVGQQTDYPLKTTIIRASGKEN
jgi:hypothetical protein